MDTGSSKNIRIGDLMVAAGYIDESQLSDALQAQKESKKRIGEILDSLMVFQYLILL